MENAVIYYTKLGHSKKIAQAVANELGVKAQDIRENPEILDVDQLYVVSGIYGGKSAPHLLEFLKTLNGQQIKRAYLLTSSGGKTTRASEVRAVLTKLGIPVAEEEFTCQGAIFLFGMGHPNKADIQNAIQYVQTTSQQQV
ncbi:MAG TPA: flavodoxin domain-containing protein [Brevefilum sp.]